MSVNMVKKTAENMPKHLQNTNNTKDYVLTQADTLILCLQQRLQEGLVKNSDDYSVVIAKMRSNMASLL